VLELPPCPVPPELAVESDAATDSSTAALAFAEQFCIDVASLDDDSRDAMTAALGASAFDYVQALYVFDYIPRVRAVLAEVAGPLDRAPRKPLTADTDDGIWPAVDAFLRSVGRLRALDPVTSELVRLRGARQHNCRLCQSLRSRSAMLAGADDELFALVDEPGGASLSSRHRAALDLTDAVIWHPARVDADLVAAVRRELTPVEWTELVLDVMRNAANKIAVALQADAPHVTEGIEIYDIDDDGDAVYGLALP
jgi:alkylhydroperoxidase family enzyme